MRDKPMACDTMRDKMRDGLEAEKQPTWTNAPLVQVRCAERAEKARGSGPRRNPNTREFSCSRSRS
jgi:hypothetical protein